MENTFDGEIYEFPGIFVDKFNTRADAYFLTHTHKDHVLGLINKSFCSRVYCSLLTKQIISLEEQYKNVVPFLTVKNYNEPFEVYTETKRVKVTLINSYHCPGSTMFLFEGNGKAVLFTGDIRAEKWWSDSLIKNPFLFPYITGLKQLDMVYLDTTFSYRGEPYISIMSNSEGIFSAIEMLKLYPMDEDITIEFSDTVSGSEEAWFQIVNHFEGELIVDPVIEKRIELIKNESDIYSAVMYKGGFKFRVGHTQEENKIVISIRHMINFNIVDYSGYCLPKPLADINDSELKLLQVTKNGHKLYQFNARTWILPDKGTELLPTNIKLFFSRHSSYEESVHLVQLLNPKSVYPCVESHKSWLNGFTVFPVFGDYCSNEKHKHRFDIERFKLLGNPAKEVINQPVRSIDRWSFSQCLEEADFVKNVQEEIPFKGQMKLVRKDSSNKKSTWYSRFKLEDIISGRGEEKYKEIMNYQQELREQKLYEIQTKGYASSFDSDSFQNDDTILSETVLSDSIISDERNAITPEIIPSSFPSLENSFIGSNFRHNNLFHFSSLDDKRIEQVKQSLQEDRRNWCNYTLKSLKNNPKLTL